MTSSTDLLIDAFSRIGRVVHATLDGLSTAALTYRIDDEANTVAWLVWHLARIQDAQIADVAASEQVWTGEGWAERFGLPFDDSATGYGQSSDEVAAVQVDGPELLTGYLDAVQQASITFVGGLTDDDLDRVVDRSFSPPVTLAVRLISVISDDLQHAGQAAFVAGVAVRDGH
ncbi:mycothiol transferase [Jatrophihabitans sp. DSM 45814]